MLSYHREGVCGGIHGGVVGGLGFLQLRRKSVGTNFGLGFLAGAPVRSHPRSRDQLNIMVVDEYIQPSTLFGNANVPFTNKNVSALV